jgi:hypothetical protein
MGDEISYQNDRTLQFEFSSVNAGDTIKVYSITGVDKEITVPYSGTVRFEIKAEHKRFYRAEVYRTLLPGLPPMLCLVTNPIYFS